MHNQKKAAFSSGSPVKFGPRHLVPVWFRSHGCNKISDFTLFVFIPLFFFFFTLPPVNKIYLTLLIVSAPPTYMCHMMCLAEHKCWRPPFSILIGAHTSTAVPMLPMSIVGK